MRHPNLILFMLLLLISPACSAEITGATEAGQPEFITSTLPAPATPIPTSTLPPPSPPPTNPPIEGITTTQLNVRSEPATIGNALGTIAPFSKVQIVGRDPFGAWYQILYSSAPGTGWITAAYVQVDPAVGIAVVDVRTNPGSGWIGLSTQAVNIRNGPGKEYATLGKLSSNDVVQVLGRDSNGTWLQIRFLEGTGWAAAEFMKVEQKDALPITADSQPTSIPETPAAQASEGMQASFFPDGDSMQAPAATVSLSGSGTGKFQFSGGISVPDGDAEDWIRIESIHVPFLIQIICAGNILDLELRTKEETLSSQEVVCGSTQVIPARFDGMIYLLIRNAQNNDRQKASYVLTVEAVEQ
ncbi:MAG: SH3 domain-containing protein [Syntrophobacteraceae bacterium]|nr:SH3 domain-containing protein [Syntrophobacteraceae bacterium]